ncbi:MAG TPA: NAD(P)H-binding protein, partial [Nitrospirota bacterium]|nr:NAD(P)H-binding protein [Nitrospirota bacterium]
MYTILGATGNVGSKIADIMISLKGENVRLVSRTADRMLPCLLQKNRADITMYSGDAEAYVGDMMDAAFLVHAFEGADAVFTLIPPNINAEKFMTYAASISESIAHALEIANVRYVVNLSSIGADMSEGTGAILALHNFEQRLNRIDGLNVMHVRAAFFMENLFMNIGQIQSQGINSSAIQGNIKFPMIATQDVAE